MFIFRLSEEKRVLAEALKALKQQQNKDTTPADSNNDDTSIDYASLLAKMALEIKEKEDRIATLMAIKENQQEAKNQLQNTDSDDAIALYLEQLESDFEKTEQIILSLQEDLDDSQRAMKSMEAQLGDNESHILRISILEKTERRLQDENKTLRKTGTLLAGKLDTRNKQVNKLKSDNKKLQKSIASLSNASKAQLSVIKKLHTQIERAQKLEDYQRKMIANLEKRLSTEKGSGNDGTIVDEMEKELAKIRDTLKQTIIEKEFIEEHMLELDESLEKARETEQALTRAQLEIANLEENFPEYEPPQTPKEVIEEASNVEEIGHADVISRPPFTTEIPELLEVMENNRLFGSLMEFWTTLDAPPLNLVKNENIPVLPIPDWVVIHIGDNDYSVLITVDEELAKVVAASIFANNKDENGGNELKDTIGELCNVIAGTIATEMDSNFSVSTPEHIDYDTANKLLTESTLVAETLASAQDKPIYVALVIPKA
jgi:CheY-specific phosphatase CheX/DNA repair exonuclease SbcCD ATPase subunit